MFAGGGARRDVLDPLRSRAKLVKGLFRIRFFLALLRWMRQQAVPIKRLAEQSEDPLYYSCSLPSVTRHFAKVI